MSRPVTSSITGSCSSGSSAPTRLWISAWPPPARTPVSVPRSARRSARGRTGARRGVRVRPGSGRHFHRRGDRAHRCLRTRAVRLALTAQQRGLSRQSQAPAAHPQGRRARGRHHAHGRSLPRARNPRHGGRQWHGRSRRRGVRCDPGEPGRARAHARAGRERPAGRSRALHHRASAEPVGLRGAPRHNRRHPVSPPRQPTSPRAPRPLWRPRPRPLRR